MDSLTHALSISVILTALGRPDLILFGILGAVAPDIDILFPRFFDDVPRYYLFTHGGVTHSICGALVLSGIIAGFVIPAGLLTGFLPAPAPLSVLLVYTAILAGSLLHVGLDFLATPGIPVLFPATDRKYTLGIFAGPNLLIMAGTVFYLTLIILGAVTLADYVPYAAFFCIVVAVFAVLKGIAAIRNTGLTLPTMNPLHWYVIHQTPDSFQIGTFSLFGGKGAARIYPRFTGITRQETERFADLPELKRLRYHSYIVTAERSGESVTFRDPFREDGFLWYPPQYKRLEIALPA